MRDSPRIISEAKKRDALRGVLFASAAAAAGQGGGGRPARKNKKGTPPEGASLFVWRKADSVSRKLNLVCRSIYITYTGVTYAIDRCVKMKLIHTTIYESTGDHNIIVAGPAGNAG